MPPHSPNPLLVHRLPAAPNFVGRELELDALRRFWQAGRPGVLALVGLGGAGKTAVAARFLDELLKEASALRVPEGMIVWSFYQEPDAGLFLQQAYRYFSGPQPATTPAKGAGLLHLLREVLSTGAPHLLVLDGLERVQRQAGAVPGVYGQLEDPLLKGLLTRVAEGIGQTVVLVTSRFPLTDLEAFRGRGYTHLDVGQLDRAAALALLRHRGVQGDDAALDKLLETYGAHALTLDHLGGLVGQFLAGNPGRAPELSSLETVGTDRQALRLARLLRAYEDHLPAAELALLCRLCLLRRSVTEEQILQLFLCSPAVRARAVRRELADMLSRIVGARRSPTGQQKRDLEIMDAIFPDQTERDPDDDLVDLTESLEECVEQALAAAPIAGPEEAFHQEIRVAAEKVLELQERDVDSDAAELARLYSNPLVDTPSDQLPLPPNDRERLRSLWTRYSELREHPLMPFQGPDPALKWAFHKLGYGQKHAKRLGEDLTALNVMQAFGTVGRKLRYLVYKHFTLMRVRQLCCLYQRKWSLAGPLAQVDAVGLHQLLSALVGRHLVLREAESRYGVHPAVRDHFHRLTAATEQGTWHDIIREQLVSLSQRPGMRLPEDRATLDLMEEAIYHTLEAGRADEAWRLYDRGLGGHRHLGWKLGEMARGLRILRGFHDCPDRWALAWYLRALGELEEALGQHDMPFFRADIRLLQGRLPQVAAAGDGTRSAIAAFLMGRTTELPPETLGSPVPRGQILLYLGRLHEAWQSAKVERLYRDIGWEGDRARCQLVLAEVACRQADVARCRQHLGDASSWILQSGSVEHLCLMHLLEARAARDERNGPAAHRALDEGLHIARQCGLNLYLIELLCEQAATLLATGDIRAAERTARDALRLALTADCQFHWGAAEAGQLLGQALVAAGGRSAYARKVLEKTRSIRRRIGHPRITETEQLLASLPRT